MSDCMSHIDKLIYVCQAKAASDMERDIDRAEKPMGVFLKYWFMVSPRLNSNDPYMSTDSIYTAAAIGISEYMKETLIEFAKTHNLKHKEIPV